MTAEQLLVGRDDVLAGGQGLQDIVLGRIHAAHDLHQQVTGRQDLVVVPARAGQDTDDLRPLAGQVLHRVSALGDQPLEGCTDGAVAQQADAKGLGHQTSRPIRSS